MNCSSSSLARVSSVPAYIQDVHTTRGAVALGGGDELKGVGRSGYLRFVAFLQALAVEHGLSGEGVEEVLFQSSRDALVSKEWMRDRRAAREVLLEGLDDAQNQPPLFLRGEVPLPLDSPADVLRVLVFADGKPMNDLAEGAFGSPSSAASLSEPGFFSGQRRRVFLDGIAQTAELGGVIVYVATTGHGLVPIDRHVPHYNVPGEKALASDAWVRAYQASVREHLAHLREQQPEARMRLVFTQASRRRASEICCGRRCLGGCATTGVRGAQPRRCTGLGST